MNELASCPHCGSYAVKLISKPDQETGLCEYRCEDCGEYFVDIAEPPEPVEGPAPDAAQDGEGVRDEQTN